MNNVKKIFNFLDSVTFTTISNSMKVKEDHLAVNFEVKGTATTIDLVIEGVIMDSGEWVELAAINLSNFDVATDIEQKGAYQVTLIGLAEIRINVKNLVGGNLSVTGKVVG